MAHKNYSKISTDLRTSKDFVKPEIKVEPVVPVIEEAKEPEKEFEIRLNDEKRKKIKKGDLIEFQKEPLLEEKIIYEVDDLFCFTNFEELINEFDIKYLADNEFKDLTGDQLRKAITEKISHKEDNLAGKMVSEGTTPRRLVDLLGSLADLTSGSGDKGTPVVYIQNYFSNYSQ